MCRAKTSSAAAERYREVVQIMSESQQFMYALLNKGLFLPAAQNDPQRSVKVFTSHVLHGAGSGFRSAPAAVATPLLLLTGSDSAVDVISPGSRLRPLTPRGLLPWAVSSMDSAVFLGCLG